MDPFTTLPEECLSEILKRTSPIDASRFAVISKGFNSAANSDAAWGRFLPSDYSQIISRSVLPVVYTTKKELYLSLCHSPILLDGGKLSFYIEKRSGKKCYMVGARELMTSRGDTQCWESISCAGSRFSEVALLKIVSWLDIRGKIKTQMLSRKTTYGAYLVFKLSVRSHGLESVNADVRIVDVEARNGALKRAAFVHLRRAKHESRQQAGQISTRRSDGWLEVELGHLYNDQGDNGDAEARLMEIVILYGRSWLIIEGIEYRPKAQFS